MRRKLALILKYVYYCICVFFLCTIHVKAYIDPSVMTYAIQAIAGTAIALGTFFSVYWRKVRKVFVKELNISKGKNYESNNLFYNKPDGTIQHYLNQESVKHEPEIHEKNEKKSFKDILITFLPAFALSLSISFMLMAYAPFQLFFNNLYEFWFDFKMMLFPHFAATVLLFLALFALFVISYVIYDKFYEVLVFFALYVFIGLYIQGNFMSGHLPPMDGTTIDWTQYSGDIRLSWIFWGVLLIVIVLFVRFLTPAVSKKVIPYICAVLSLVMIVTCITAGVGNGGFKSKDDYVTLTTGELELGENKNFVILMFDALDSQTFRTILNQHPEYNDVFEDFTYYPNTLAAYPFTEYSVPFVLTGKWNENTEDFRAFETRAMDESPLFTKLEESGYDMSLYESELVYDSDNCKRFSNITDSGFAFYSRRKYLERMNTLVMFQYLPFFMKQMVKPRFDFNSLRAIKEDGVSIVDFYLSNKQLYTDLQENGIRRADEERTFKFIHVDGAHVPFQYDKDVNVIDEEKGTYPEMIECCVTITNAYLQAMKDAGLYDNTAVIIMADHGYGYREGETISLLDRANPFLMVKGVGENHEFKIDEAPISYEDLQEAYARLLDGKTGNEVFDWKAGDKRTRRYLNYAFTKEYYIEEYFTDGYADDVFAMIPSGKTFILADR